MSLGQVPPKSPTPLHDLDGSDRPTHEPKSQAQYAEEVKAHLEAARAALRLLTVASVEVLCSDPTLDPVYVGCMRELAGLGYHGGKERVFPRPVPMDGKNKQQTVLPTSIEEDVTMMNSRVPGYVFTVHFFPRDAFTSCARADRPSEFALTNASTAALKKNPSTAHITTPTTVSWTTHGDIHVRVPPDAIPMEEFVPQVPIMKVVKESSTSYIPLAKWGRCRLQGAPSSLFLRLHRVPASWIPRGDFTRIHTFFPAAGSDVSPQLVDNFEYTVPQDFLITGMTLRLSGGEEKDTEAMCDAYIDLLGLEPRFVDNLRKACKSRTKLKGKYGRSVHYFSTSFVELRD